MHTIKIIENWNEFKGKLKLKFVELSDNDFLHVDGKEDVLIGRLQIKSGKRREDVVNIINGLQAL